MTRGPTAQGPREAILSHIQAEPGLTLSELRKKARLGWGVIYHHLGGLERDGLVRSERRGRYRLLFAVGATAPRERGASLRGKARHSIAHAVATVGPTTTDHLIGATGLTRRVVYHHLKALRDAGLVERDRWTRTFTATPKLLALLDQKTDATSSEEH